MAKVELILFDVFAFSGMFLVFVVIVTAWRLPRRVPRTETWAYFMLSTFLASVVNVLIVGCQDGWDPNDALCSLQAILNKTTEAWNAFAGAALLLQVYLRLSHLNSTKPIPRGYIWLLCGVPCAIFFIVILIVAGFGLEGWQPLTAHRDPIGMQCRLDSKLISRLINGLTAAGIIVMSMLKVLILSHIRSIRKMEGKIPSGVGLSVSSIARGYICNFFVFASLV
ncbi:hypothetical protein D9613_003528 [Agrocybe pediades]|uniref:Uncharacterized protein n=1 Tax=Agrocybe pediades TaxID=84607 RepID=A0A8H4QNQ5_9AGAR|nr:hypothetical protein D9613_003528 [Agrocybe pediades]